jgi:hypothetical protein
VIVGAISSYVRKKIQNNSPELNVVALEVVDVGLGEHRVVLQLRLAERWGVASNDDKLGLSGAESLEDRLVSEGDLS